MLDRHTRTTSLCQHLELLEGRAMLAGDLAITAVTSSVEYNSTLAARRILANVTIENIGDEVSHGDPRVDLFLSADDTIGTGDFRLTSLPMRGLLPAGGRTSVSFKGEVPLDQVGVIQGGIRLAPGEYRLIARVTAGGADDATTDNNTGVAAGSIRIAYDFGDVGAKQSLKLRTFLSSFEFVTISLTGGGHGELVSENGGFSIHLTGTTSRSKLTIQTPNRFISATLNGIVVDGPIGSIVGKLVDVSGDITIAGSIRSLQLRDISGSAWSIGGTDGYSRISIRSAINVSLSSSQPISSLIASTWSTFDSGDDVIAAPQLYTLRIAGAMDPDLSISGMERGNSISRLTVGGAASGRWDIVGNVGTVKLGSTTSEFAANVAGNMRSFNVTGNMSGALAAADINAVTVGGNLASAVILAGTDLGSDGRLGGTGAAADLFGTGKIGKIRVNGSMSGSLFAAGMDPVDSTLLNDNDRFVDDRSSLGGIVIRGTVTGSTFAAPVFKGRIQIDGDRVSSGGDPRFVTSLA